MSIESFSPLPLNVFGAWVTLLDPSDVPIGMSPNLGDVDFFPGGVRTRPGLVSQFTPLAGGPNINGLKTYITTNLNRNLLVFDSLGNLYIENTPGTLSLLVVGAAKPSLYLASTTHFGREYMAFGDGLVGQDLPRQFDDVNYDRVSQIGPAEGPAVADGSGGSISPGVHQVVVVFVTRQGFWTAPSPPVSWTAAGALTANLTDIPTGPSNVAQRLIAFTASGGASFYHVPATMVINDNTTTSLTVDFSDTILLSGVGMDYLFSQIELPEQLGVVDYAERLFWWGERANMDNWRNLTFDGGWDASGNGRPLGWTQDPSFGAGGSRQAVDSVWGDAYQITADGSTSVRGYISQNAITDVNGDPLFVANTDYSVRARVKRTGALAQGIFRINAYSPTAGLLATGMALDITQVSSTSYQEFIADLFPPQTSLPSDLTLRVYADGLPLPAGEAFKVDCIEVFETNASQNPSLVRCSGSEEPEAYDGVSGIMSIAENNGQGIRAAFTLRNNLYFVKERSMYVTATDGVNEPALWQVEEVSNKVGTPSAHGVALGEEWAIIAGRSGVYLFDGSEPVKLSQEIQPTWDQINWEFGQLLWVQIDTQRKRVYIGAPIGSATQPNQVFMLDYTEGFGDPLVAMLTAPERSRKWASWKVSANSCGLIERSTGIAEIFFGSNNASGKIYAPTLGAFSDDGAAINSFYSTAFLAATSPALSGRNLFGYLTAYVQGAGTLALTALTPGDVTAIALGNWTLASPASRDMEQFTNVLAERVSYQLGTNAVGAWFSITKLAPWAKPDPFAIVRGGN